MSRRAIKAINWSALAERLPESERATFSAFKSNSDKYLQRMMANPETMPQIDWAYYRKAVITPGLVDKFQKEYEALSIPYPQDKYTEKIDIEQQEMAKKIESFNQQANEAIAKMKTGLDEVAGMIPFAEMTMEDYRDAYPEGFMRTDIATTWPHTEESQEDLDDDSPDDEDGH
ncbi:ATP synthase subunit d, mitochondrial [Xylocopa sonorina]|uniref:ATP synthase subunit d, mitochondrial n=1 Tax=Xylocopa sonorina TaxID=1818115 RepID=UPI00403ABC26